MRSTICSGTTSWFQCNDIRFYLFISRSDIHVDIWKDILQPIYSCANTTVTTPYRYQNTENPAARVAWSIVVDRLPGA